MVEVERDGSCNGQYKERSVGHFIFVTQLCDVCFTSPWFLDCSAVAGRSQNADVPFDDDGLDLLETYMRKSHMLIRTLLFYILF